MPEYKRALVLLADGTRYDVLHELLNDGGLPNIQKHLLSNGKLLKAATSFPSTTGPAHLPFLTGCLPATCNVPGIRWIDRARFGKRLFCGHRSYVGLESFHMGRDIDPRIRTVYEIVGGSYSIFNSAAKGAGRRNVTRYSRIWHWYYAHLTDRWSECDEAALNKLLHLLKRDPSFVFAVFPGIDEYSHLTHPRHPSVRRRYEWLDDAVGKLFDKLHSKGMDGDTAVFLVSDHGLSATHTHFCVNEVLIKNNLPPFFYPKVFDYKDKLSANMISGNGMTHIYIRSEAGWDKTISYDELMRRAAGVIAELVNSPAVDIVCVRDGDAVRVISRRGAARLSLNGERIEYDVDGGDPFGYAHASVENSRECLENTIDTGYPDAPFQIAQLFTSPRCGDIVLSATPGYDLRREYEDPEHKSSHGSLCAEHMLVPIVTNAKLERDVVRTVDVFPTVLNMLGYDVPQGIDGEIIEWRM